MSFELRDVNFKKFLERFFYRVTPGSCLFHVQVAKFPLADIVKTISQVLFKDFMQEREVPIRRRSFT